VPYSTLLRNASTALNGASGDAGGLRQALGSQRFFAQMEDSQKGPPAEKDTGTARGVESQAPVTEQARAARVGEENFEDKR